MTTAARQLLTLPGDCLAGTTGAPTGSTLSGAMHDLRPRVAEVPRHARACIAHAWPAPAAGWAATRPRPRSAASGRWSQA